MVRPSQVRSWFRDGELGHVTAGAVAEDRDASVVGPKDGGKLTFCVLGDSGKYEKRGAAPSEHIRRSAGPGVQGAAGRESQKPTVFGPARFRPRAPPAAHKSGGPVRR
jgi:hypothetical protein